MLRRMPLALLQPAVDMAVSVMSRRHPDLIDSLTALGNDAVLIDPSDVPVAFLLRQNNGRLFLRCVRTAPAVPKPAATIGGRLSVLVSLAEGDIDGDALFFTRDLTVRGDTGLVLTLRNALERSGIKLSEEIRSVLGPLTSPMLDLSGFAGGILERLDPVVPKLPASVCKPTSAPARNNGN